MKILVLVKQIPDISAIKFDQKTKRIIRSGVKLLFNSYDKKAVEAAVQLSEKYGYETYAASMGPPDAAEILKDSMRMGINHGILLSDRNFAGSDTFVTSHILSALVNIINPDIVLTGKSSLDGETSQVPPETAWMSGYNFLSGVSGIEIMEKSVEVTRDEDDGISKYEVPLPAFFSVSEKINRARQIDPSVKIEDVEVYDSDITPWKGSQSPTEVVDTFPLNSSRNNKFIDFNKFIEILHEAGQGPSDPHREYISEPETGDIFLGLAVDDPKISMEISSKIAESTNDKITVIGNIDPVQLQGMACHQYVYLEDYSSVSMAKYVAKYIQDNPVRHVLAPSNLNGRDIMSFVAASMGLGLTADCVDIKMENGKMIQYKPSFGGGIIAVIKSKTDPDMATVRKGMFQVRFMSRSFETTKIRSRAAPEYRIIERKKLDSGLRPLDTPVIFGIGTGVMADDIPKIYDIADKIGASVGATRRVVDMGRIPRQFQIGLTGVSVSPELYIAIGVSGSDNHVVGTRYAGRVMAVNKNPDAPIFRHSDFGIVMDSHEFIGELYSNINH
ncbi:MAG: FAD-binding protein [Ferroplasma sp.]|uniref:FAD-binding protein n=1 Tax=Ferroplasma sp. TaxID=2591003 RepID=UPI0028166FA6|nr:FAD-binding protein [Ferroplasma sp.]WMT51606.1 MAG: FAD-binding protein [Ferroplasma sp.]